MPFEFVPQTDYLLLKLQGECPGEEAPRLMEAFVNARNESGLKLLVVQCSECSNISVPFLRQLGLIYKDLKTKNGNLRFVSANEKIVLTIRNQGLDRVFVNKQSLRGALVDFGLAKSKEIDANFVNPFLTATQKVLKIQCFLNAKVQKPHLKQPKDPLLLGDISGIISISSETFNGTLAISLPEPLFCKIAENMLGEPCPTISEGSVDLVGELANIILGQAKLELAALGYAIQMAIPSCVWGRDHKIKHFGGGVCVVIPFETEFGIFHIEIMTQKIDGQQRPAAA